MVQCFLSVLLAMSALLGAKSAHAHGGISGGGGFVIDPVPPAQPYSVDVAKHQVFKSHDELKEYLVKQHKAYRSGRMNRSTQQLFRPIFADAGEFFRLVGEWSIDIRLEDACPTMSGQEADGCSASRRPNAVCMSAFNLARKVREADLPAQSLALLLHEFTEAYGLSEEQAAALQKHALDDHLLSD